MRNKFWEKLKFWDHKKKSPTPIATIPAPKKDFFKGMVEFFIPVTFRKIKNRQRGLRKGLSRREWEKRNGTKWCLS